MRMPLFLTIAWSITAYITAGTIDTTHSHAILTEKLKQNQITKKGTSMQKTVLVTGGAGYIGSHTAFLLAQQGYQVIILDLFVHDQPADFSWATIIRGDCGDQTLLNSIFTQYHIDAVMHFAAFIEVGISVKEPLQFYENNVTKTLTLLKTMLAHNVKKFIFSSSCAVYGTPRALPLTETHERNPISPYGNTKYVIEMALNDLSTAYGLQYVALRYFNAAGALPEYGLGEYHKPETHVLPLLLRAAREHKPFYVFGTNYPTLDGSCVRDYLHVLDIGSAHLKAFEYLQAGNPSTAFNLGTGTGFSVRQLIAAVEKVTGIKVNVIEAPERAGDPAVLVADPSRAHDLLNWKPQYSDLEFILKSAYAFHYETHHPRPAAAVI